MVSREQKRAAGAGVLLNEKLQLLRSITNSHALSRTSIIADASKCIMDLKQKVERLNQDITSTTHVQHSSDQDYDHPPPVQVSVETLEKGFLINVISEKSCQGLLVSVLEAFEELGLNVLEARVSCTENFCLEAVLGQNEESRESIDAKVIKQVVSQAIKNWSESSSNQQD